MNPPSCAGAVSNGMKHGTTLLISGSLQRSEERSPEGLAWCQ